MGHVRTTEPQQASTSNTMKPTTGTAERLVRRPWCSGGAVAPFGGLYGDVLTIWREAGSAVSGGAVESGHYPAEEAPDVVLEAFERFFV